MHAMQHISWIWIVKFNFEMLIFDTMFWYWLMLHVYALSIEHRIRRKSEDGRLNWQRALACNSIYFSIFDQ